MNVERFPIFVATDVRTCMDPTAVFAHLDINSDQTWEAVWTLMSAKTIQGNKKEEISIMNTLIIA